MVRLCQSASKKSSRSSPQLSAGLSDRERGCRDAIAWDSSPHATPELIDLLLRVKLRQGANLSSAYHEFLEATGVSKRTIEYRGSFTNTVFLLRTKYAAVRERISARCGH